MSRPLYFIENLSLFSWFLEIWPRLVGNRLRRKGMAQRCYIIDGSGLALAKASAALTGIHLEKLSFRALRLKDDGGTNLDLRMAYGDIQEVQEHAVKTSEFQKYIEESTLSERLPMFLAKSVATKSLGRAALRRILLTVQVCANRARSENETATGRIFLDGTPPVSPVHQGICVRLRSNSGICSACVGPSRSAPGTGPRRLAQLVRAGKRRSLRAIAPALTASPRPTHETGAMRMDRPR